MPRTDEPVADGRILRGEQTRRAILRRAADIASAEGLAGLSIGRLATELRISKSGVFTHFGSKEELQVATVRAAAAIFREQVVQPALEKPPGLARVWALCEAKLHYILRPVFPGGCFFYDVAAEFDARPGRVRDAIADALARWRRLNEQAIAEAQRLGELAADVDPAQLAFELDAFARAGGGDALLQDDPPALEMARHSTLTRLRAMAKRPEDLPTP